MTFFARLFYVRSHNHNLHFTFLIAVGARVFARWTNGFYYRGFVSDVTDLGVSINFDDGDKITLSKIDKTAVVLDKIPLDGALTRGQRVIGYWPKYVEYFPGHIFRLCDNGQKYCLLFDHSGGRDQDMFEIRAFEEDRNPSRKLHVTVQM